MINSQLLEYIKSQLSQNVSKEVIRTSLVTEGWSIDDINRAFLSFDTTTIPINVQKSGFRLLNPIIFVVVMYVITRGFLILIFGVTQTMSVIIVGMLVCIGVVAIVSISRMQAGRRLSFFLFFTSYLLIFLNYSLYFFRLLHLSPDIVAGTSILSLFALLAPPNLSFFPIIIAYLASFLFVTTLLDSAKKIAIDFVTLLIISMAYYLFLTFPQYFYFIGTDEIAPIFIGFSLATVVALAIKFASGGNPAKIKWILVGICLVSLGTLAMVYTSIYLKTASTESCDSFPNADQRYNCNRALAMKDMNLDLCMKLNPEQSSDGIPRCLFDVLLELYKNNKLNSTYCSSLNDSSMQSVCFNRLVLIDTQELYCENVKEKYDNQNVLLYSSPFDKDGVMGRTEVGGAERRPSIVFARIDSQRLDRIGCYSNVARIKKLPSICSHITDESLKSGCEIDASQK